MIKKIVSTLLMTVIASFSHYVAANVIYAGKVSHFNEGDVDGWLKGPRSNIQPEIKRDAEGNQYLEVVSTGELTFEGERDPDSRLKVLNHTTWLPDYNLLGITALKVRMANLGKTPLHMRLFFGNTRQKKMCMSELAVELSPDEQWQDIRFSMERVGLICGKLTNSDRKIEPADFSIEDLKKNIDNIFFISLEKPESNGKIEGVLGIDRIEALTTSSLQFIDNSAFEKQAKTLDLRTDVVVDSELIQHISDTSALMSVNGESIDYKINTNTGILTALTEGKIETLRPVAAILTEQEFVGIKYSDGGYKQLFTANNRRITTFPQSNAEADFAERLQTLGLTIQHDGEGNLAVFSQGGDKKGVWFSVRVDSMSTPTDAAVTSGLLPQEYSNLKGVTEFIHNYLLDGHLYQQNYHATPADWHTLKGYLVNTLQATDVSLSAIGIIKLTIAGIEYQARVSALVSPHDISASLPKKLEFQGIGDMNNDGLPDFKVIYKNGQSQTIYLLP